MKTIFSDRQSEAQAVFGIELNIFEDMNSGSAEYKDSALHLNAKMRTHKISKSGWTYRTGGYQPLTKCFTLYKCEA